MRREFIAGMLAAAVLGGGCGETGLEPDPVTLPVVADGSGVTPSTNDLGWTVALSTLRVAIRDVEFTIEGETHASVPDRLLRFGRRVLALVVPLAVAHPGHAAGGEVTGELSGRFLLNLVGAGATEGGAALGGATLLPGDYHGMNLTFRKTDAEDGLAPGDPLAGHTAVVAGTATRNGRTITFEAVIDIADGTQMIGGPFVLVVDGTTASSGTTLGLTVYTVDPSEHDSLFDGVDFGALDSDGDGDVAIAPGEPAHNVLMKTLVRHDHWGIVVR